jgi:spore germination protein GerM
MVIHIHVHTGKTRDARSLEAIKKDYLEASDLSTYTPHDKVNRAKSKLDQLSKEVQSVNGGDELERKIRSAIKHATELLTKTPMQSGNRSILPGASTNMTLAQQGRRAERGSNFF